MQITLHPLSIRAAGTCAIREEHDPPCIHCTALEQLEQMLLARDVNLLRVASSANMPTSIHDDYTLHLQARFVCLRRYCEVPATYICNRSSRFRSTTPHAWCAYFAFGAVTERHQSVMTFRVEWMALHCRARCAAGYNCGPLATVARLQNDCPAVSAADQAAGSHLGLCFQRERSSEEVASACVHAA